MNRTCSSYRGEVYTGFCWGDLTERGHFGRHRRRWENIIKMDLQEVGLGGMDSIALPQDRDRWWELLNAVMNLRVP